MGLSPRDLTDILRDEIPAGVQGGKYETLAIQAVRDAVAYGASRLRERVDADLWGDGVTTRFALTGRSVRLFSPDEWATPTGLNTAGIAAPSVAATYTAGTGGALPIGTYLGTHAWETTLGVTSPVAVTSVTVATSGTITRGVLTVPSGATVATYLSTKPGGGELRRVATGGDGSALVISAVPSSTAATAQVDYTALSTLTPDDTHLQPGTAPDGSTSALVSTLILGTAIPAGSRVRVPYERTPIFPSDLTVGIGLDEDYLRLATKANFCRAMVLNSVSGDATAWANIEKELFAQVDQMLGTASGRRGLRARFVNWS